MNIKNFLRKALLLFEGKHKTHKNEYGCVMVFLDVKKDEWDELQDMIDEKDLYQPEHDPTYGRENEPHVTLLYGLHGDVKDEELEPVIEKIKKPKLSFGGVSAFKNDNFEVLKFDVDSKDLHKANKKLKEFPYTNSYPDYHPHCTIAYLKPGKADKYIKKLKNKEGLYTNVDKLVYSKVDGSKKDYKFNKK
jgi:2'-5' RNA ligase